MMKKTLFFLCVFTLFTSKVFSAEYTVEMKNSGAEGSMIFEPAIVRAAVGDTIHFVPTDMAHNSESIEGLTPKGSVSWTGEMNKKVSVTLDKEGVYVYKCAPHSVMAMVGVIVAGKPTNLNEIKENAKALNATFFTNKDRLNKYLAQIK